MPRTSASRSDDVNDVLEMLSSLKALSVALAILDGDADKFGQQLPSQHYSIVYGDIREELRAVCEMMNILIIEPK